MKKHSTSQSLLDSQEVDVVSTALCPTEVQAGLAPSIARPTFGQSVRIQRALMLKYGTGKGDENVLHFFLMHPEEDSQWLIWDLGLLKLYWWDSCPLKHKSVRISILFHDVSLVQLKIKIALIKLSYLDCCILMYIKRHLRIILCSILWFSSYWDTEILVFWNEMLWNFLWVHEKFRISTLALI